MLPDVLHQVGELPDREVAQEALGEPGQLLLRVRQAQLVNALSPAGVRPGATFVASASNARTRWIAICSDFSKPSDGLEPSTPPYHAIRSATGGGFGLLTRS